jgi:predicted transcriptional regulator
MRIKDVIGKTKVQDIMHTEFTSLDPSLSIEDAVRKEFKHYDYGAFPVTKGEEIVGLLTLAEIKRIPRIRWDELQVSTVMYEISNKNSLQKEESALAALTKMIKTKLDVLPIVENATVKGIVTQDDLMKIINDTAEKNHKLLT